MLDNTKNKFQLMHDFSEAILKGTGSPEEYIDVITAVIEMGAELERAKEEIAELKDIMKRNKAREEMMFEYMKKSSDSDNLVKEYNRLSSTQIILDEDIPF